MSKEEILEKAHPNRSYMTPPNANYATVYKAMDEYARQEAIGIVEFLRIGFIVDEIDDEFRWRRVITNDMQDSDSRYTALQLYQEYIKQKS